MINRIAPSYFRHHFRAGRYYGFPTCCIFWFCAFVWLPDWVFNPPANLWRRLGMPESDRQFVPCPYHYHRLTPIERKESKNETTN